LLKPETQAERLKTVPYKGDPGGSTYGLGIGDMAGWLGHMGDMPGFNTVVAYLPALDATLVVMANTNTGKDPYEPPKITLSRTVTGIVSPNNVIGRVITNGPA
jgi:D-alanyl-D-alanine carboxypeptidase